MLNILVAEDDKEDFFLIKKSFGEFCPDVNLTWVQDGEELMEYLTQGRYKNPDSDKFPPILLDLNMPRKDGRQALEEIKNDPNLCVIPVVVFTTSNAPEDMRRLYQLGASAYVLKPNDYTGFMNFAKSFKNWLDSISLPTYSN